MRWKCGVLGAVLLAAFAVLRCDTEPGPTYRLADLVELLAPSFYAGDASDGSNVAGRAAFFGQVSNDGTKVAFWAVNTATRMCSFFVVDVGDPDSYRRITADYEAAPNTPLRWTPDDSALFVAGLRIDIPSPGHYSDVVPWPLHGITTSDASVAALPGGNWEIAQVRYDTGNEIVALPILGNGHEDPSRQPVFLTDFRRYTLSPDWVGTAPDGTAVAFADYRGGSPAKADVYVLRNLPAILSAPPKPGTNISSLAPTGSGDSNLVPVRTWESANVAEAPDFSGDGSLVIYSEDFSGVFSDSDFFGTFALADFELMVSNADGSGSDFRLRQPGNQAFASSIPGDDRIVYSGAVDGSMHLLMATLEEVTSKEAAAVR